MFNRPTRTAHFLILAAFVLPLALACGRPSAGIGITIPGTPISIGMSAPLDRDGNIILTGRDPRKTVYREVTIASNPPGAEIVADGEVIGTTPSTVAVPFDKGWFGRAKGSTQIKLRKAGYAVDTFRLFPAGKTASLSPDGGASGTIQRSLGGGGPVASQGSSATPRGPGVSGGYSSR